MAVLLASTNGFAQTTPAGLWKTIDDESGRAKALVRINEHGGLFDGRIEKLVDPNDSIDAVCEKCTDERHNKSVLGMVILRNVTKNRMDAALWEGGDILDPNNGNVYRVRLFLRENGQQLDVRGYIGVPMFGRTQTWRRME